MEYSEAEMLLAYTRDIMGDFHFTVPDIEDMNYRKHVTGTKKPDYKAPGQTLEKRPTGKIEHPDQKGLRRIQ